MKCPKCGYLGFESVERCRNCGYDFSLISTAHVPELSIRSAAEPGSGLPDLALDDKGWASSAQPVLASPDAAGLRAAASEYPTPELPLFRSPSGDDTPLITRPSPPRTPLAVRRATPEVPRLRDEPRTPMLDLGPSDSEPRRTPSRLSTNVGAAIDSKANAWTMPEAAGIGVRVLAVAIDATVLAAIDVLVVYFTLQICGLTLTDFALLPRAPLLAFLVVQNIGYFVAFTTGGQTLGQMALSIKVVATDADRAPNLGRAIVRTLVWAILTIPAGLGLVPTALSDDRRGLHDRCAGTRVVRATA